MVTFYAVVEVAEVVPDAVVEVTEVVPDAVDEVAGVVPDVVVEVAEVVLASLNVEMSARGSSWRRSRRLGRLRCGP